MDFYKISLIYLSSVKIRAVTSFQKTKCLSRIANGLVTWSTRLKERLTYIPQFANLWHQDQRSSLLFRPVKDRWLPLWRQVWQGLIAVLILVKSELWKRWHCLPQIWLAFVNFWHHDQCSRLFCSGLCYQLNYWTRVWIFQLNLGYIFTHPFAIILYPA